jgi:fumarate reductase subunit D
MEGFSQKSNIISYILQSHPGQLLLAVLIILVMYMTISLKGLTRISHGCEGLGLYKGKFTWMDGGKAIFFNLAQKKAAWLIIDKL